MKIKFKFWNSALFGPLRSIYIGNHKKQRNYIDNIKSSQYNQFKVETTSKLAEKYNFIYLSNLQNSKILAPL
jgi:hypothetical protein